MHGTAMPAGEQTHRAPHIEPTLPCVPTTPALHTENLCLRILGLEYCTWECIRVPEVSVALVGAVKAESFFECNMATFTSLNCFRTSRSEEYLVSKTNMCLRLNASWPCICQMHLTIWSTCSSKLGISGLMTIHHEWSLKSTRPSRHAWAIHFM
jgi:hypothetical protein